MAVPYTFGTATAAIPLSQLDSNFATTITLGNTAIQLGNTVTTLNNMTLANVTITSGTSSFSSIANGTSNVTIASSGGAISMATNGTTAVNIDTSQNISFGSGVTVNAYQGTSPSNGAWMGTVGSAGFFLANQTSTNTNLYLSKASGYTDSSLLTTYVNGVTLGGLRVTSGNTAMNLYGVSGITFPATQIASADANTLDDYEEGTWTPSLGGNTTYTARTGTYTKIGRFVFIWADITVNVLGTGSASYLSGIPFASTSTYYPGGGVSYFANLPSTIYFIAPQLTTSTSIAFITTNALTATCINPGSVFGNSTRIVFSMCYEAA